MQPAATWKQDYWWPRDQKPKRGRYKPERLKPFAYFGSWCHRTRRHRKGKYRPSHS